MADLPQNPHGIRPPPARNERGHTLPRRTPPEQSVTLLHHQLARNSPPRADRSAVEGGTSRSTRRSSVGESNATCSEPKYWFDKSNRNPTATFDHNQMDVDPPFFQQETDSSNELELPPRIHTPYSQALPGTSHQRPAATRQSSSADDYRSVIDDLTIENKRLKEELKRYKQSGSGMMKKEKLFEIKVHGLPNRKKRELEATLRDFAASLEGSSETASQERLTKPGKHMKNFHASRNSLSKHASSSSTNSRPLDSAYASMSTGPSVAAPQSSTGPSFHGPPSFAASRTISTDRKVEGHLLDTPEGLLPRHTVMTDREKKKMVVRRLEQLFTGKISAFLQPRNLEAVRESRIQTSGKSGKKAGSRDNMSVNSGDRTEPSGAHGVAGDVSGNQSVHNEPQPPEQRPTRPRDLDPHRVQVPGENMDYIRHLGIVRSDFLVDKKALRHDVAADADGWVYLNLLSNLAQLHMVNVTPAFIRSAVSEKSTKFQLSADGRKIRWRGGTDGTKFSSDSSTDNSSQKSPSTDEDDPIDGAVRKKRKTSAAATEAQPSIESIKGSGSKSLLGQVSTSSSFHYKPLFVRQSSSVQTSSSDGKASQASLSVRDGDSPNKKSPWNISGSGSAQRMKRRRDGAIIYYSGAPFCTDLSGDRGDISPTTYMTSNGQERDLDLRAFRPIPHRSWSGSSLLVRPLSDDRAVVEEALDIDLDDPQLELATDDGDSGIGLDLEFPWCDKPTSFPPISFPLEPCLEPCGLGGVMPEDHFAVICYTRHPVIKAEDGKLPRAARGGSEDILEAIAGRLASMSTSSPAPSQRSRESSVDMTYLSGRMRRLDPVPLPPPARFIPPFSSDSSSGDSYDESFSDDEEVSELQELSESLISKLGNPRLSDNAYIDSGNASSNDDSNAHEHMVIADLGSSSDRPPGSPTVAEKMSGLVKTDRAAANVGEEHESGYSSSVEDDESPPE